MSKLKGAGILAAMVVAGLTLLGSFPVWGAGGLVVSLNRLEKACLADTANYDICVLTAGWLDRLARYGDAPTADQIARLARKFRRGIRLFLKSGACCDQACCEPACPDVPCEPCQLPCADVPDKCERCVFAVQDIEARLATNGTAQTLQDTLGTACQGFDDATRTQTCLDQIAGVPVVIDLILTEAPPLIACRVLRNCPQ